jgi:diaminopimelate epimerase
VKLKLTKCHGSGNDFLLVDEEELAYSFSEEDRQNLAIALCDRSSGIGADGILFVLPSEKADAKMRIFNADGSEASMCGNGLRCVGRYVCERLGKENIIVETMKADLHVQKSQPIYRDIPTYTVEISPVLFNVDALPMNIDKKQIINEKIPRLSDQLTFSAVAVPNPHLISVVEDTEHLLTNEQKQIAQFVNGPNDLFPDGVNVSFVKPLEKGTIYVRTYERGVGFTNACGTAMSASSLITCLLGYNDKESEIQVYNPGGKVRCVVHQHQNGDYEIDLIGNATFLFHAEIEVDVKHPESFTWLDKTELTEQQQYEELEQHAKDYLSKCLKVEM